VDIDLSSLNREDNPKTPAVLLQNIPAKRKADRGEPTSQRDNPKKPSPDLAIASARKDRATSLQEPQAASTHNAPLPSSSRVQILDLASDNPIISYQGQVYSGVWTDMVGTNMFFTQPGKVAAGAAMKSTAHYDMLGTSRIKLAGHRVKLTRKEDGGPEPNTGDPSDPPDYQDSGRESPEPGIRSAEKRRVSFLNKVKKIKQTRGDTDQAQIYSGEEHGPTSQRDGS
jgi:hypothetical protein